jgi:DNA polymerase elongation subunit (family B)
MYRNVCYNPRDETVTLFTWDDNGTRVAIDMSYNPYIYTETTLKGDATSIFETPLRKKIFKDTRHRNNYIKECGTNRVFENLRPEQQFLIDTFWKKNDDLEFSKHPLRIQYIDIEVYCPDVFPTPEEAAQPINIITVYDTLDSCFYTWGTKRLEKKIKNCEYVYCETEQQLLECYLNYVSRSQPDVISGWNSEGFDIPYIVNRCARVLGEDSIKKLSPVENIYSRLTTGAFGKQQQRWYISGVSCVDYLDIYKKFSIGLRESYKLDAIAELELGSNKVDYGNTNLSSLADDDWQLFVEYNVQDVNLLVELEDKLRYLELLRMLAYTGLTTIESAMGTLSVITGATVIKARSKNLVVPTFIKDQINNSKYEGAYVGEPQRGFQHDVISFDANSLYPNTMISLNLSPETKVGKITHKDDEYVYIKHVTGKDFKLTHTGFMDFVKKEDIAISRAKILFTQKKKGIMPEIVDGIYQQRVEVKKQLKKLKLRLSKMDKNAPDYDVIQRQADQLDIKQFTLKILINTVYGYFGNKHAPIGDPDIARSITLTGQAVIKKSNDILRDYVDKTGVPGADPVIYNDTDSSYISIARIMKSLGEPFSHEGKITQSAYDHAQAVEDHLNMEITKWSNSVLNSNDSRFVFKRECMSDVGVFLQKKRYVLHVLDDEGIPVDKYKYTGVEVVRSTIPAPIKPYIKQIIETMMSTESRSETNEVFLKAYDIFKDLPVEDYSFVMGISDYEKYAHRCNGFVTAKGMPAHVKAAYHYNMLLEKLGLSGIYETIDTGDKVRFFYVTQPNKYGINAIAYKYYYPKEFKSVFEPDKEKMFEKIIYSIIERFYESVDWKLSKPSAQVQTDLFDLLGV